MPVRRFSNRVLLCGSYRGPPDMSRATRPFAKTQSVPGIASKVERVEELVLPAVKLPHHDDALPSIDIYQDTEISGVGATFSTQSANNGHSVVVIGPVADGAGSTLRLWRIEKRPYPLAVVSCKLPA